MSVGIDDPDRYETKTVEFQNPGGAESYMVMMTAFNGMGNQHLEQYGYRGRYVMFIVDTGGNIVSGYDPHKIKLEIGSAQLSRFLTMVKSGYKTEGDRGIKWSSLEDGGVYKAGNL